MIRIFYDPLLLGVGGIATVAPSSSPHDLGWFPDPATLIAAHPTAVDGDFAIVGTTDTFWTWDSGTTTWVNTYTAVTVYWQKTGTTLEPVTPGDRIAIAVMPAGGSWVLTSDLAVTGANIVFNSGFLDRDFTINKLTSGAAYKYDAGDDQHIFSGKVSLFGNLLDGISTGIAANDKLITKGYADDGLGTKQAALGYTPENVSNKRTTWQATPDDTAYPSEKLVKDTIDALPTGGAWAEPAADHTASGTTQSVTVGESVVFGDLLYLKSDGKWWKSDANAAATMPGLRLALASAAADAACSTLVMGLARDDTWTWTVGGMIFASAAAVGGLTQTAPSGSADIVQPVGVAYHADKMIFQPSLNMVEVQ